MEWGRVSIEDESRSSCLVVATDEEMCNKGQDLVQLTLIISNSNGPSEILRNIRTWTYQICRIEEKIIRTTTFNKYICNWTLEVRGILKILWKRGEIAP